MPEKHELVEIWGKVCLLLREEMSSISFDTFFSGSKLTALSDENHLAVVSVPSQFRRVEIENRFKEKIENYLYALRDVMYHLTVVDEDGGSDHAVVLSGGTMQQNNSWFAQEAEAPRRPEAVSFANNEYQFENFVVGGSNSFAHAVCKAVATNPAPMSKSSAEASSKYYNPLFIYGPSGVGKTHLLYAVAKTIRKNFPELSIVYIKGDDFANELIESLAKHEPEKFREKYRHAQVLLIDDIQFIAGKRSTQQEFFHTFNELYEESCQIILTCDRPPKDIELLEDRLRTRFEWGMIADIQMPDPDLRLAILQQKCTLCHIAPPQEVLHFLADKLRNNIRQLEGAVKKIAARKMLTGEEITMQMVKDAVADLISDEPPEQVSVERILSLVGQKYNIPVMELRGKKRTKEIALARHVAIYLIRATTNLSYPQIGKEFDRDHATIMSSEENIRERMRDPLFEMDIQNLIRELS